MCCHSPDELQDELRKGIARLRRKTAIIQGFIRQVVSIHV